MARANPNHEQLMTRWEREGRPRLFNAFGRRWKAVKAGGTVNFILIQDAGGLDAHYGSVSMSGPDQAPPTTVAPVLVEELADGVPEEVIHPESGGEGDVPEAPEGEQPAGDNRLLSEEPELGDVVEADTDSAHQEADGS